MGHTPSTVNTVTVVDELSLRAEVSMAAVEKNVGEQNNDYLSKSQLGVGVGSSYFVRVCIPPVLLTGKF